MENPRWPHTCKIYRVVRETSFDDGDIAILYKGACRKYGSDNLRTFKTDNVIKCDYALSLPGTVCGILSGDSLEATDNQGTFKDCLVVDAYAGNLGTTVYFNVPKN